MKVFEKNIEHVIKQAKLRRNSIHSRLGIKNEYTKKELVAKSQIEVEYFDSIDSLTSEEMEILFDGLKAGGLQIPPELSLENKIEFLFFNVEIDKYWKV
jgi:hypothetical protein